MAYYWLTPPSRAIFFVSVLLAVLALLVRYAHVAIPVVSHYTFETLLLAMLASEPADDSPPWPRCPQAHSYCC